MRNHLVIIKLICSITQSFAINDSTKLNPNGAYWTPRLGMGLQSVPYIELGISRLGIKYGTMAGEYTPEWQVGTPAMAWGHLPWR